MYIRIKLGVRIVIKKNFLNLKLLFFVLVLVCFVGSFFNYW